MMRKKHRIMVISAVLLLAAATGIGVYYGISNNTQLLWSCMSVNGMIPQQDT